MLKLFIKNMVCNRCIKVVKDELEKLGFEIMEISLGEVVLKKEPLKQELEKIKGALEENGFELLEDKKAGTVEKIKNFIIEYIHSDKISEQESNFSELISAHINQEYHYLSNLFSTTESLTIEQFIILQKIERAKELIKYNQYSLGEIAYRLGYSSPAHLSRQFKKVTGMTASEFKNIGVNLRKPLDKVAKNLP